MTGHRAAPAVLEWPPIGGVFQNTTGTPDHAVARYPDDIARLDPGSRVSVKHGELLLARALPE